VLAEWRTTIGVKARLIEWERAGGSDRFNRGLRTAEQVQAYVELLLAIKERLSRYAVGNDADGGTADRTGAEALGLSECIGMGWRFQDIDGASYTASVCDGFSARRRRIQESRETKSVASATPKD